MIEPTDEMRDAFSAARAHHDGIPVGRFLPGDDKGLRAALAVADQDQRARIAFRIRAELVCCDIYDKTQGDNPKPRTEPVSEGPHSICFWGEAAARIAEEPPQ